MDKTKKKNLEDFFPSIVQHSINLTVSQIENFKNQGSDLTQG